MLFLLSLLVITAVIFVVTHEYFISWALCVSMRMCVSVRALHNRILSKNVCSDLLTYIFDEVQGMVKI